MASNIVNTTCPLTKKLPLGLKKRLVCELCCIRGSYLISFAFLRGGSSSCSVVSSNPSTKAMKDPLFSLMTKDILVSDTESPLHNTGSPVTAQKTYYPTLTKKHKTYYPT